MIAGHLADGEVAVLIEIGREGDRYLVGVATAVNAAGDTTTVDLDDIYERAAALGTTVTRAEH